MRRSARHWHWRRIVLVLAVLLVAFLPYTNCEDNDTTSVIIATNNTNDNSILDEDAFPLDDGDQAKMCSSLDLHDSCTLCGWTPPSPSAKVYNCSLPGLTDFVPGGQYEGVTANYLSHVTQTSSPSFPLRAKEFEACTGGKIFFSESVDIFQDPVADIGTSTTPGAEVYDAYFMSYSHFPGRFKQPFPRIYSGSVVWKDMESSCLKFWGVNPWCNLALTASLVR